MTAPNGVSFPVPNNVAVRMAAKKVRAVFGRATCGDQ